NFCSSPASVSSPRSSSFSTSASIRSCSASVPIAAGSVLASKRPYASGSMGTVFLISVATVCLPPLFAVLGVCQHVSDVDRLAPVGDLGNQPIIIPPNIEHGATPHEVGVREIPAYV